MREDLLIKSKSLTGSSDLTLIAPLKRGLVPSLETLTYKTRTQRLLKMLNGGRTSAHEFSMHRPISDSVERVSRIHSFRVAVLEPEDKVLLAVTFDGTWDAYIRVLWQKVGTLLDIIFCNTEGYVLSLEGFDAWTGWVRKVQVETGFFFNTHGLTVNDAHYLREFEQIHRSQPDLALASIASLRFSQVSAEDLAIQAGQTTPRDAVETVRQGLQSLALLFRMTDVYLPGTPDGDVLLRAARDLLKEFRSLVDDPDAPARLMAGVRARFARQLDWLAATARPDVTMLRTSPPMPDEPDIASLDDVQGGMLDGYSEVTHGCLVLLSFDTAAAGVRFLTDIEPLVTTAASSAQPTAGSTSDDVHYNVAFTVAGLRAFNLTESELEDWMPHDFREGMEERASMLGDFRANHPRRWKLPQNNWDIDSGQPSQAVRMSAVHLVVQIRARCGDDNGVEDPSDPAYPMRLHIERIVKTNGQPRAETRVLSVQPMRRMRNQRGDAMEHFGFADGQSQPGFLTRSGATVKNRIPLGELLIGYANEADEAPLSSRGSSDRLQFLHNGSFMVVRKLHQDVPSLRRALRDAEKKTGMPAKALLAKMMGRWQNGGSLTSFPTSPPRAKKLPDNDFDFTADPQGVRCPFHSHVRRANPRTPPVNQGRRPRLVRRGMSYGPLSTVLPGTADDGDDIDDDRVDRGLVFIAYNASLSEQFEVVQRWIAGGNSTGGFSGHSDPFMGVPEAGQTRHFRFEGCDKGGKPVAQTITLDTAPMPFDEPRPFVRLHWGIYCFVPSMRTLRWLRDRAAERRSGRASPAARWDVTRGCQTIERLKQLQLHDGDIAARQAWKAAIEDSGAQERLERASLWAAVRSLGGALRTPYGVLVASRALVGEVLGDDRRFSVSGYRKRMVESQFDIYLGLDRGPRYERLSNDINAAIMSIGEAEAFALAAGATESTLRSFVDFERMSAAATAASRWELNLDAKEVIDKVQQRLCQEWLGLPAGRGGALEPGSWRWDWHEGQPPIYPTHFTPPSRYFFQPCPADDVTRYGERYAAALAKALESFIAPHRRNRTVPLSPSGAPASLASVILASSEDEDDATVARTFAGVLMGFLPTLDANVRLILNEWLRLETFWSLRARWLLDARPFSFAKARVLLDADLKSAMQFRPSPDVIWRTVKEDSDAIGDVPLVQGDVVVVSLMSATHEASEGSSDVYPVFGGDRRGPNPPTHACPGYDAAMGVMLGILSAFVDVREVIRPSPAPLAFTLEGEAFTKVAT